MKSYTLDTNKLATFRKNLLAWYKQAGRDLPWRHTHNPYYILVSEMMLQQTQVARVQEKYAEWLELFPDIETLAKAPRPKVLKAWSGLGYNRRAIALHEFAERVVNERNGVFPNTVEDLQTFKGIGPYTAHAVMAFAFKKAVPLVDTNVKRVLGRIFLGYKTLATVITQSGASQEELFWQMKQQAVPKGSTAYNFNQGIMDFGAMQCTARKPACGTCPMQNICKSYPEILTADANSLRVKVKVVEPQFFGQPQRIWRGRVLKIIQTHNVGLTYTELGKTLQADWDNSRLPWLKRVVASLEKDGMVRVEGKLILP